MDNFIKAEIKYIEIEKVIELLEIAIIKQQISRKAVEEIIYEMYKAVDLKKYKKPTY